MTLNNDPKSIPKPVPTNSVTTDLINRLQSGLPPLKPSETFLKLNMPLPKIMTPTEELAERLKIIEEENKKIRAEFEKKLQELKDPEPREEEPVLPEELDLQVGSTEAAGNAVRLLQQIVDNFNADMDVWYQKTGCDVIFGWKYDPKKKMEVVSIDLVVFKKQTPSALTIKEALENTDA